MRYLAIFMVFLWVSLAYGQNKFAFNKNGITPKYLVSHVNSLSKTELYHKTLNWIKITYENPNTEIDNQVILLTGIKENALQVDKRYFHLQYTVKLTFKKEVYKFEPLKVLYKANSKYDMGWKDFDLSNGEVYFKKGKAIKSTKAYVKTIPKVLNDLNTQLNQFLISR